MVFANSRLNPLTDQTWAAGAGGPAGTIICLKAGISLRPCASAALPLHDSRENAHPDDPREIAPTPRPANVKRNGDPTLSRQARPVMFLAVKLQLTTDPGNNLATL